MLDTELAGLGVRGRPGFYGDGKSTSPTSAFKPHKIDGRQVLDGQEDAAPGGSPPSRPFA